jgi:hypothetical protein
MGGNVSEPKKCPQCGVNDHFDCSYASTDGIMAVYDAGYAQGVKDATAKLGWCNHGSPPPTELFPESGSANFVIRKQDGETLGPDVGLTKYYYFSKDLPLSMLSAGLAIVEQSVPDEPKHETWRDRGPLL